MEEERERAGLNVELAELAEVVACPHCAGTIDIAQLNCGIFRHAVFKSSLEGIPPHTPMAECERLVASGAVYGCGKPFRARQVHENGRIVYAVESCDYI